MSASSEAHLLLHVLAETIANEAAANSDGERRRTQDGALKIEAALLNAIGTIALRRRRMVVEARGLPSGSKVETADFEQLERDCVDVSPEGQVRLRQAMARHELDTAAIVTTRLASLSASNWLQNAKGRDGPLDGRLAVGGVDPGLGADDELRNKIVADTGYTIGIEIGLAGRIPDEMWMRAKRAHNKGAGNSRRMGLRVHDRSAATIKAWSQKEGPLVTLFRNSRRDGATAKTTPDRERILPP